MLRRAITKVSSSTRTKQRGWGGARPGAGRKKKPGKLDPPHRARPEISELSAVHIVLRTRSEVPRLRQRRVYRELQEVLAERPGQPDFRVCQLSIQARELEVLVEASSKHALSEGMRRFNILVAKAINRALGRSGTVFAYRYEAKVISTPAQASVLCAWRRYGAHEREGRGVVLDPYASAATFDGWIAGVARPLVGGLEPLTLDTPRTRLLRSGWRKDGGPRETPGPHTRKR
jgi:hypothetical protein